MTASPPPTPPSEPLRAAAWMGAGIVAFSTMAVAGREVSAELDTFELMLYRSVIGVLLVLIIARTAGTVGQISTQSFGLHVARNISHFAGQNSWFAALTMIPLAQVIAIEFTSPVWVALLAPLFLGERLTPLRLLVAVLGFIGVLIVARPGFATPEPGVILAACAAVGFAGSAIFTKRLTRVVSITNILFWLTLMQAVFGLVCAGLDGDIALPSTTILPWVALVSVTGLSAHFCLTTALGYAPAVIVMPFDFLRLPVIATIGALFYAEGFDPWVIAGACIIFGANFLNLSQETRANRDAAAQR